MTNPSTPIRILIAGGGTGGHVLPAIAVIEELRERGTNMELLWVGSHKGVEGSFAEEQGIPFQAIQTGKMRRYFDLENVKDIFRIPIGFVQAFPLLKRFQPDVIFATGSNVGVPTILANLRRVPVLTHEQTAQVSNSSKISAKLAHRFACSYEETAAVARTMHDSVVVTGNPVRRSLLNGSRQQGLDHFDLRADLPVVFVTGGARGASAINERIETMLPDILDVTQIIHQTGPTEANPDFDRLQKLKESLPEQLRKRYQVRDMIRNEMADVYATANLVIGRAGAGTVAELAYLGIPALLIPLGGTWGDEQRKNAAILANAGAAIILEQAQTSAEQLEAMIRELIANPQRLEEMSSNARSISHGNAAANVADELLKLAGR